MTLGPDQLYSVGVKLELSDPLLGTRFSLSFEFCYVLYTLNLLPQLKNKEGAGSKIRVTISLASKPVLGRIPVKNGVDNCSVGPDQLAEAFKNRIYSGLAWFGLKFLRT